MSFLQPDHQICTQWVNNLKKNHSARGGHYTTVQAITIQAMHRTALTDAAIFLFLLRSPLESQLCLAREHEAELLVLDLKDFDKNKPM